MGIFFSVKLREKLQIGGKIIKVSKPRNLKTKHWLDFIFLKDFSRNFGTFRHDNYGKKKKMPYIVLFSKIDVEDVWNIMGNNIFQHALFKM